VTRSSAAPAPREEDPASPEDVRPTLVTYLVLTAVVVLPFLWMVGPYAVSIAMGGILAVLCAPGYARLRRRMPAFAAGILMTLGVVLLVVVPVVAVLGAGFKQASGLLAQWSEGDAPTLNESVEVLRRWLPITDVLGTPAEVRVLLTDGLRDVSGAASRFAMNQVTLVPAMIVQLLVVVLSTYFLLVDGPRLFRWVTSKIPLSRRIRLTLAESVQSATTSVVLASIAAAGSQAAVILVAFLVLRVPMAFLGAVAAFIFGWIPTVGPTPIWLGAAVYLYLQGSTTRAVLMLCVGIAVGIIDNVVRPLVLRGRQEMHPFVSLLAILGGIALMGVPGVFLGPLLASLAISVLEIWPAVASHCGIPVTGAGEEVPDVPLLGIEPEVLKRP
jgi:predicted PurR-regulated permease PerM